MECKTLTPEILKDISNMLGLNKDMEGARQQCQQYKMALNEIGNLIKTLKSNHNMKMQKVYGGNLLLQIENKTAIHDLQERKQQIEVSLSGIEEQIKHREDNLVETFHKVYVQLRDYHIPQDMK